MSSIRRYAWAAMSVIAIFIAGFMVNKSRRPDLSEKTFRIGFEESRPTQFVTPEGEPAGAVIDVIREAANRRGIRLQWVHSYVGAEASLRA